MKNYKKNVTQLMSTLLIMAVFLSLIVFPVSFGAVVNDCQVHVPLVIDLSYAVAGVQFTFEYSAGLEFVSYEKSSAVSSALTTPVVVKNGYTYLGFYNADNLYAPKDGKLDAGYLVFNCLTDDSQQVTLTEIKLVQIVDDGATRNAFVAPVEIKVSSGNVVEASSVDSGSSGSSGSGDGVSLVDAQVSSVGGGSSGDGVSLVDAQVSSVGGGSSGDGVSLVDGQNLLVDTSDDFWLPAGFWIVLVFLFVVACVAGVFILVKKHVNIKS
jgi:hypothetical protein